MQYRTYLEAAIPVGRRNDRAPEIFAVFSTGDIVGRSLAGCVIIRFRLTVSSSAIRDIEEEKSK